MKPRLAAITSAAGYGYNESWTRATFVRAVGLATSAKHDAGFNDALEQSYTAITVGSCRIPVEYVGTQCAELLGDGEAQRWRGGIRDDRRLATSLNNRPLPAILRMNVGRMVNGQVGSELKCVG
jgi:hypothetical protein